MKNADSSRSDPVRVFLCHASEDKPVVLTLYERLLRDGFKPWLDKKNLKAGMAWRDEISKQVREASAVVVCLSQKSERPGFLQKEIRFALDIADEKPEGMVYIIPARLDPKCNVPERLRKWHWVDLFQTKGYLELKEALLSLSRTGDEDTLSANHTSVSPLPLPESIQPSAPPKSEVLLERLGLPTAHLERGVRWSQSSTHREVAAQMEENGEWRFFEREPGEVMWDVLEPNDQLRAQADKIYRDRVATLLRQPSAGKSDRRGRSKHL